MRTHRCRKQWASISNIPSNMPSSSSTIATCLHLLRTHLKPSNNISMHLRLRSLTSGLDLSTTALRLIPSTVAVLRILSTVVLLPTQDRPRRVHMMATK